jgi:hypothetical protein
MTDLGRDLEELWKGLVEERDWFVDCKNYETDDDDDGVGFLDREHP